MALRPFPFLLKIVFFLGLRIDFDLLFTEDKCGKMKKD